MALVGRAVKWSGADVAMRLDLVCQVQHAFEISPGIIPAT